MYNPITGKDIKQKEYLSVLEDTNLSLFDGYSTKQILFNETAFCLNASIKDVLKLLLKCLLFKSNILDLNIEAKEVLLLYSKNYRSDHDSYWEKIKEDVNDFDSITILQNKKRRIDIIRLFKKIGYLSCFLKELRDIKSIKDRCFFSVKLVDRRCVLDDIDSLNLYPKVVMCFSDNSVYENVLMQYFKKQGATTFTNQHGLCIFQSYEYDRLNQSQILNFKCDYYLARGSKQKEQFVLAGYDPDRIKIVGFIGASDKDIPIQNTNCIGIYLDCPTVPMAKDNNEKMVYYGKQIANKLGLKYLVKCHPQDTVENYRRLVNSNCIGIFGKETTLVNTFKEVDMCITNVSATYVDVYIYGLRCFKMNSEIIYPIAVKEDEFDSVDCAIEKIRIWKSKSILEQINYIQFVRKEYSSIWKDGNISETLNKIMNWEEN